MRITEVTEGAGSNTVAVEFAGTPPENFLEYRRREAALLRGKGIKGPAVDAVYEHLYEDALAPPPAAAAGTPPPAAAAGTPPPAAAAGTPPPKKRNRRSLSLHSMLGVGRKKARVVMGPGAPATSDNPFGEGTSSGITRSSTRVTTRSASGKLPQLPKRLRPSSSSTSSSSSESDTDDERPLSRWAKRGRLAKK